ncbi:MAG TPA: hypothetical protein VD811_07805 [Desulfuromonadales bacterium]|nr:hypothetical protein [Desulfuromonadales bacterium]
MKILACMMSAMVLLAGCASTEEAYYLDREFGLAQQAAWDNQVAYPDYRHVAKTPETTEGIAAEKIMDASNKNFAEQPEIVNVFQLGITQ